LFQGVVLLGMLVVGCYFVAVGQPIINECRSLLLLQAQLDCWNDHPNAALYVTIGAVLILISIEGTIRMLFSIWLRQREANGMTQRAQCVNGRCNERLYLRLSAWIGFVVQIVMIAIFIYNFTYYFHCNYGDEVCIFFQKSIRRMLKSFSVK